MPPNSRGRAAPAGLQSKSTPNLPGLGTLTRAATAPLPRAPYASPAPSPTKTASACADGMDFSEESSSDEQDSPSTARPLYLSRSQTHLAPHTASALFPPFYNRPPTPLPPSPSLTSLLRPSFASRPTTPDSSDTDLPPGPNGSLTRNTTNTNLASITKSAQHAPTVPRASPKVPTYEYYGFALYLASSAAFLMYILWAYVPSPLLHQMGIHYYPNRWWALAVPAWLVVLLMYIYVALASYNTNYLTLPLSSCENLVDECGQIAVVDRRTGKIVRDRFAWSSKDQDGRTKKSDALSDYQFRAAEEVDWKKLWSTGTDAVLDVPIGGVCEILYGRGDSDG